VGNFELRSSRTVNVVVCATLIALAVKHTDIKRNPIRHMKLILPGKRFERQLLSICLAAEALSGSMARFIDSVNVIQQPGFIAGVNQTDPLPSVVLDRVEW
jgi:hypothetical protein